MTTDQPNSQHGRFWAYACAQLGGLVSIVHVSYFSLAAWGCRRTDPEALRESERQQQMYLWFATIFAFPILGLIALHEGYAAAAFSVPAMCSVAGWFISSSFIDGFRAGEKRGLLMEAQRYATTQAPCDLDFELPPRPEGEGFVYIIQFSTGVVKVGQTIEPRIRLGKHRRDAGALNVSITKFWVSPPHVNYMENETSLINHCGRSYTKAKQEYFYDANLLQVRTFACGLKYYSSAAVTR